MNRKGRRPKGNRRKPRTREKPRSHGLPDNGRTGRRDYHKAWSGDKPLHKDKVKYLLTNPFYYGIVRYSGEMYEGRHTPIIEKRLFDRVQEVVKLRGRIQKAKKEPTALCRLMRCGECGCSITAETITKHQQNGNIHRYVYYRCTKKRDPCPAPYIREEVLTAQLNDMLSHYVLPPDWAKEMRSMADKDEADTKRIATASVQELRTKTADIDGRIARLTDLYVEQDIERSAYLERKHTLMSERKSAEEQIARLERDATVWLQPLREWIKDASLLDEIIKTDDLPSKKSSLRKIFGSNLVLQSREARGVAQNQWTALGAVHQKKSESDVVSMCVRGRGFEPPSPCGRYHLKVVRLPVSPPAHILYGLNIRGLQAADILYQFLWKKSIPPQHPALLPLLGQSPPWRERPRARPASCACAPRGPLCRGYSRVSRGGLLSAAGRQSW